MTQTLQPQAPSPKPVRYTSPVPPPVIANPILNAPFSEPERHFKFNDEGITDQIADGRRASGYFLPIASPRKKGGQLKFETEWTQDRFLSSPRINRIRERVNQWRSGGYVGCTRTTERLLQYWGDSNRERKLFFCQREALETAIYLTEVASHFGDAWIENELRKENADFNGGLPRLAMKMATGSGKTVVMAMLIAWQALNKLEDKHDRRFSDAFLIVTPGITIRDRLRVLLPTDPQNYYRERDIVPGDMLERLGQARIVINDEEARVWMSGIEAVHKKIGIRAVFDLSATPFFLRGSGYPEGTLFPWVVSDFSLIDAIESGIVKIPRVPVEDNSMTGEQPTYRDLWLRIRDDLPKKAPKADVAAVEPNLPAELEGAIQSLYQNYQKAFERWASNPATKAQGGTPPVFMVVCSNVTVSKMVFDYIAGWTKTLADGTQVIVPGRLVLFNNESHGQWSSRPTSILVDSRQLESDGAMSAEFKKIAAIEIEEFKADYRERFPGRDADDLTDEDLLREVMNTVGKEGKLGEQVRCVVSVSMLTEGWDANTVTHILGVRAFGTQLLCEQVVGRGLRRVSYAVGDDGRFAPEYAEVYGVPFSFIPCSGATATPTPGPATTHVRALENRAALEITFPRVQGYRFDVPTERLTAVFTEASHYALSTAGLPTKTENAPIVGESETHTLEGLRSKRLNEVAFQLAHAVVEKYFSDVDEDGRTRDRTWLFPQLLSIAKRWMAECLICKDNTFPQLLLLAEFKHDAADKIYQGIVRAQEGEARIKPILRPHAGEQVGTTRYVSFDTAKPTYATDPGKSHVSHVVADTGSWEQKMAQVLEELDEVECYLKNQGLNFTISYMLNGDQRQYFPDFIVRCRSGLNLIVEVSGEGRKDKAAKVAAAQTLWVPAINNHGGFGRWAFVEVTDPWDAIETIRAVALESRAGVR